MLSFINAGLLLTSVASIRLVCESHCAEECTSLGLMGISPMSAVDARYFTRTVGAGGVCVVIVLRLERYMGHCECQLNTCSTQTPTDLRSPSHCTLTITHLAPGCATGMTILPDAGAK